MELIKGGEVIEARADLLYELREQLKLVRDGLMEAEAEQLFSSHVCSSRAWCLFKFNRRSEKFKGSVGIQSDVVHLL